MLGTLGQAAPPAEAATPAATPPATPSESTNYRSNPKNGGIAQFSAAAMPLMVNRLLHHVPQLIAVVTELLPGTRTTHNRPKMNILPLHPGGIACLVGHTPGLRPGLRGPPGPAPRRAKLTPGDWPFVP